MTLEPGTRVVTSSRNPPGHNRLPRYLRDKPGRITAVHGAFPFADAQAAGVRPVRREPIYTVVFDARDLWGADAEPGTAVAADLFGPYLVPVADA